MNGTPALDFACSVMEASVPSYASDLESTNRSKIVKNDDKIDNFCF